ncbi:hypothetical protein L3X38_024776 [Prunus dulcis]|uniref:Uncharacterized protein n=1 Tax=Prunus dulcis TaxID=3755 RepID=A0AAD4Z7D5_PRUDU|nr:hypothetical protein L3X38_024776 [Prunus dulcis]
MMTTHHLQFHLQPPECEYISIVTAVEWNLTNKFRMDTCVLYDEDSLTTNSGWIGVTFMPGRNYIILQ